MSGDVRWRSARTRLRRRFYRKLFIVYRFLFPADVPPPPIDPASLRRILIDQRGGLGDMVVTTPVLEFLRHVAPQVEIDVLGTPLNVSLLDRDPRVSRRFVLRSGWRGAMDVITLFWHLRSRRYDLILTFCSHHGNRAGWLASVISDSRTHRVAWSQPREFRGLFTTMVRYRRCHVFHAEHMLWVAQSVIAAEPPPLRAEVERFPVRIYRDPTSEERADRLLAPRGPGPFVAVNLSAGRPERDWPASSCIEVLRILLANHPHLTFVLTPPPDRAAEAHEVEGALASDRVFVHPPTPRVLDTVAVLAHASVVVSPDTAIVHIAAALGRPVLGLYAYNFDNWAPLGVPYRTEKTAPGEPVSTIPVVAIVRAFEELWREVAPSGEIPRAPERPLAGEPD